MANAAYPTCLKKKHVLHVVAYHDLACHPDAQLVLPDHVAYTLSTRIRFCPHRHTRSYLPILPQPHRTMHGGSQEASTRGVTTLTVRSCTPIICVRRSLTIDSTSLFDVQFATLAQDLCSHAFLQQ